MEVVLGTGSRTTVRLLGRSGRMAVGGRNLARCGRESRGSRGRPLLAGRRRRRRRWRSPTLRRGPRQGGKSTARQEVHFLQLSLQQKNNKLQMFPRMTSDLQARQAVRQERKVSQEVEDDSGAGRPLRFHILIILIHIMFRIIVIITIMIRSPDEKQASLHLSRERSLKSISNWWRSSLEGDLFHFHFHNHHCITSRHHYPPQAVQSSRAPQQTAGRSQSQRQVLDTTTATVTAASPPCLVSLRSVSNSILVIFLPPRSFLVHLADVRVEQLKRELAHLVEVLLHRLGLEHPAGGGVL